MKNKLKFQRYIMIYYYKERYKVCKKNRFNKDKVDGVQKNYPIINNINDNNQAIVLNSLSIYHYNNKEISSMQQIQEIKYEIIVSPVNDMVYRQYCKSGNRKYSHQYSTGSQSETTNQYFPKNEALMQGFKNYGQNQINYNTCSNEKYKIQLCRNFINYGYCPYGQRCQYAHGTQELRCTSIQNRLNPEIMPSNNQYKTKPCREFHKKGYCIYGQTCNYLHSKALTSASSDRLNSTKDQEFKELIKNVYIYSRVMRTIKENTINERNK